MSKLKQNSLILLLILTYLVLACIKLAYPGLHYDEILFGNAALGGIDGSFIHKSIYGIPVMLMPYIGALKSSVYYFIFSIFDPSYISIRLPMILLTAVSLWIIYKYIAQAVNNSVAILSILFLVADSSLISLTRTDVGPVAFGLFFRSLALLYFFKFIQLRKNTYLAVISLSLLFGFYDKLNFIWFINAFIVSVLVFYPEVFNNTFNLFKTKFAKIVIGIFLAVFLLLLLLIFKLGITKELNLIPTAAHLNIVYNNAFHLINGSGCYEMVIGEWRGTHFPGWAIVSIIVIGSVLAFTRSKSEIKTFHFFNLLMFLLILTQTLFTKQATAPWHVFMLQPNFAILLSTSLIFFSETLFKKEKLQQFILLVSAGLIFCTQIFVYSNYISAYENSYRAFIWSKKIDDLFVYSQSVPNKFVSMDWGTHTQLLTLSKQSGKYYELFFAENDPPNLDRKQQLRSDYFDPGKEYLFLFHSESKTLSKSTRRVFFELADSFELKPQLATTIDENGEVLFEIYQLKPK